jgi:hypothetical protein
VIYLFVVASGFYFFGLLLAASNTGTCGIRRIHIVPLCRRSASPGSTSVPITNSERQLCPPKISSCSTRSASS